MFARDDLPLKNPNPDDRLLRCSEDTLAPEVLTKGIFKKVLEAPSHVILNHANCWTEKTPTLAPPESGVNQLQETIDDGRTSSHYPDGTDKSMTAVSLTLRLNINKFATLTYYKPRVQSGAPNSQNLPGLIAGG